MAPGPARMSGEPGSSGDPPKSANADKDDLGFESSAFEKLEKDFQHVLTELVGDKSLERFRQEYEKLHRALKKSHESEKRLIKKCRELNAEIFRKVTGHARARVRTQHAARTRAHARR